MHEWVEGLTKGQRVLDLGCGPGAGSLSETAYPCSLFLIDSDPGELAKPSHDESNVHRLAASGDVLPFADGVFDVVICNHVLEHVPKVDETLTELARVMKPDGRLYVSVPNGYGLCDAIYRFLYFGGDHCNRFRRAPLVARIERVTHTRLTHWQNLYSSFAYFSRMRKWERGANLPRRLKFFVAMPLPLAKMAQGSLYWGTRALDFVFRGNWSLYGWALFFEHVPACEPTQVPSFVNVCFLCGSGHDPSEIKREYGCTFRCKVCGTRSLYFPPFRGDL